VEIEWHGHLVLRDGLIWRVDLFATADDAFAAFSRDGRDGTGGEAAPGLEPSDTAESPVERAFRAMVNAFNAGDWERHAAALHPDFTLTDHRPMLRNEVSGREAVAGTLRSAAAPAGVRWTAKRVVGNPFVQLMHCTWAGVAEGAAFEVEFLDLHGLDADGVLAYVHNFDVAQKAEALALYERLAARAWSERESPGGTGQGAR
jgi:hypothetical protein